MYCGTSNIVLPVANKSHYPAEFRRLTRLSYYATLFNSLEVNQTFYKLPRYSTVAKWVTETPDGFCFSMKMGKEITHNKGLAFERDAVRRHMEVFEAAGAKKGCLLVQLPGGTRPDCFTRLEDLLETINEINEGWKLAIEFRHPDWYIAEVYELLSQQNAILVEQDMPRSASPPVMAPNGTRYFRFHGVEGDYRGSYNQPLLQSYAAKMKQAESAGEKVYAYFNNTLGDAVHNALTLVKLMR